MRFETLLMAVLPALALADLHKTFVCYNRNGHQYHEDATTKACNAYKSRNTGSKQWDQCPDCTLWEDAGTLKYCGSDGWHLGGDEVHYYCQKFGASDSLVWN